MTAFPRVALFSDSHYEANGVARTTSALEAYASRRALPMLSVHAGPTTRHVIEGSLERLELGRWGATSIGLEHDLSFDVAFWRHVGLVRRALLRFKPDVLHFTGPSDVGQLAAYLGSTLRIPMVGSWHTNLHEYASRRLRLPWLPVRLGNGIRSASERGVLGICLLFYKLPKVVLAPNAELGTLLESGTRRPVAYMTRGVDVSHFTPARRSAANGTVNIGYVGRLSPEKSVRMLGNVAQRLQAEGLGSQVRFTIVGEGAERAWLQAHLPNATFTGVLRGDALADTYADMDVFVCPSQTETVGNVALEAMASGVPAVAMAQGGPRFVVGPGAGILAEDHPSMIESTVTLVRDRGRREVLAAAARAWALTRSWDAVFDGVYRAYTTAVELAGDAESGLGEVSTGQCVES